MIDSHVHFWNFNPQRDGWISEDMEVLQRDYMPADVERICKRYGVTGIVAVQAAQTEAETDFLCSLAKENSLIRGVVGWTDLLDAALPHRLHTYEQNPVIKGFRHIVQAESDGFLLQPGFLDGIRQLKQFGYTYDILVSHEQLPEVVQFLENVPDQKFMIDHCAKPPISSGEIKEWASQMRLISEHEQVMCKVSGLITEAEWHKWEKEDLYPYLDVVFEHFGTERLTFGSDWPVIYTSGFYGKWLEIMQEYMQRFSAQEQNDFFSENAKSFYSL